MSHRLKILHVNVNYGRGGGGGTEQSLPNTCRLLEEHNCRTAVLYSRATGQPDVVPGRNLCHVPGICNFHLCPQGDSLAQALAFIEQERPDVVHIHQINNHHLADSVASRWPTLYFIHNHILTCPSGSRLYKRNGRLCHLQPGPLCLLNAYTQRCNSRRPGRVLATYLNCFSARAFARRMGLLAVDTAFMKESLIVSGYDPAKITVTPTVTSLPLVPDPTPTPEPGAILYVGQITEEKGLHVLLQALALLRNAEWRLTVAGDGYALPDAQDLAQQLGLGDRVSFRGFVGQSELAGLYLRAAIVAVPTIYPEPLGLVGPEAMAYARPVVGFDVGGIGEWLHDGVNGLRVAHGDVRAFAGALDRLLQDPETARQMGGAGRELVLRDFHPQRHVDTLLQLYTRAQALFDGG